MMSPVPDAVMALARLLNGVFDRPSPLAPVLSTYHTLLGPTAIDTVAAADTAPRLSRAVYVNVAVPVNPTAGVYVNVPSLFIATVPELAALVLLIASGVLPSGSVSLPSTLPTAPTAGAAPWATPTSSCV